MKATITVWGIEMDVEGEYQPSERMTHDYPGCAESFSLDYCFVGGVDIGEMLTSDQKEIIEEAVINNHGADAVRESAMEARADEWRDMQLLAIEYKVE